jgi:hypothetical protein
MGAAERSDLDAGNGAVRGCRRRLVSPKGKRTAPCSTPRHLAGNTHSEQALEFDAAGHGRFGLFTDARNPTQARFCDHDE